MVTTVLRSPFPKTALSASFLKHADLYLIFVHLGTNIATSSHCCCGAKQGIDDRNQFELTLSCPGGVEGLSVAIEQLHHRGVHVLWAYNPWDHSTSGQQLSNETDMLELAEMMKATGADGFNGDTMVRHPPQHGRARTQLIIW